MRQSYIIAIIVLIVAMLWMLPAFLPDKNSGETTIVKSMNKEVPLMHVETLTINSEPMLEQIEVNGQTKASRIVQLRARISGRFSNIVLERGAVVKKNQLIAHMDIDDKQSILNKEQAILRQRTTQYDVSKGLENKGFNSKVKLETARANLQIAKADVKQAKLNLSHTKIKAPFAGILETQDIEIGSYVREGDIISTIVDLNPIDIRVFVSERHISDITLGVPADVILPKGEKVKGVVHYISKLANNDTRTFRVDVRINNPNYKIPSGLTAQVVFLLPEYMAHHIPLSALVLNDDGIIGVKVAEKQNKNNWITRFKAVSLLQEGTKSVWIDGLDGEVELIIVGQNFVMDGKPVIVAKKDSINAKDN